MEGATVLVVDDDDAIRSVVTHFLEDEGYQPRAVRDGREAIDILTSGEPLPDIMLLDLLMPDIDGYAVLEHLRHNMLQQFPVLIFSAQRPDTRILAALDSELRDFVAKPFEIDELLIRMQSLLRRSPRFAAVDNHTLRIYALGALRVYRGNELLFDDSWRNKPAKTIFKRLLTGRGQRYPKDVLIEELWPDAHPDVGINRLRVAIHELRKVLRGQDRDDRASIIGQQEGSYFFDVSVQHWTDVEAFEEAVDLAREHVAMARLREALEVYEKAEALYQGDYLRDDPFFEWSAATREQLRETRLTMLADAARIHAVLGEPGQAAAFCRKILRAEPWREEVYRHLMEYLVAAGRPHEALRAYEECRRTLQADIDAVPSPVTTRLQEQIREMMREQASYPEAPSYLQEHRPAGS